MSNKKRHSPVLLAVTSVAIAVVGVLLFLEAILQVLPVRSGLNAQPVSAEQPIFRFEPNRSSVFSKNWNLALANEVRTNNAGFVNRHDYDPTSPAPLLAVIGDSYIEAAMVPQDQTVHALLQDHFGSSRRVYSFAASGAGLAQYLAWIRHARDTYRPDSIFVSIISNDFSEALWEREQNPGFHGFKRDKDAGWSLELAPFEPGLLRTIGRQSALVRYLVLNLQVVDFMRNGFLAGRAERRWVANVAADADDTVINGAFWATRVFLDQIEEFSGLSPHQIVFSVDGVRPEMYRPGGLDGLEGTYWLRVRADFIAQARARGHAVIDLHEAFTRDFSANRRRFEYEIDSHWNHEGHRVIAEQILALEGLWH